MVGKSCTVEGCDKPARSGAADLCPMHYHRQYRHGDVNKSARNTTVSASHGRRYRSLYLPQHPLASASGRVYAHRAVLFDTIGPGPHRCHWCSTEVRWESTRGDADCLNVDHLNGIGDDNRPANLVPSCPRCNTTRGSQAKSRALREAGWWSQHDTVAQLSTRSRRPTIDDGSSKAA